MNIVKVEEDRKDMTKLFKGIGVEVGVAKGEFSKLILQNEIVTMLYGVDPFEPHEGYKDYTKKQTFVDLLKAARANTKDFPNFKLVKEYSMSAVKDFDDESLDFVYIDADHSYSTTMEDIIWWSMKVKRGGIVAGDDYVENDPIDPRYDVFNAVNDYAKSKDLLIYIYRAGEGPDNWMFIKK